MMKTWILLSLMVSVAFAKPSPEQSSSPGEHKPKIKAARDMNFDSQLVEGQIYRPDLSVITGDTSLGGLSVLRLRTDLRDLVGQQSGGAVK